MSSSWRQQKRHVEQLTATVEGLVKKEHLQREMLKSWSKAYATRYETVFWAGITGFVFLSRRRKKDKTDRANLLVELGIATWAVQRWRKLPGRVEASLDRARQELRAAGGSQRPTEQAGTDTGEQ
jgi:hypothetical protein